MSKSYFFRFLPFVIIGLWSVLLNYFFAFSWRAGRYTFFIFCFIALLYFIAGSGMKRKHQDRLKPFPRWLNVILILLITSFLLTNLYMFYRIIETPGNEYKMRDLGKNTLAALYYFFDKGKNPYENRCQLKYDVTRTPGVKIVRGEIRMMGLRYYYGYHYFPAMFLVFQPFRYIQDNCHAIRFGNLAWYLASLIGVFWLAYRLAPERRKLGAGLVSLFSYISLVWLCVSVFYLGHIDIFLAALFLFGFTALTYDRWGLAGLFFGVAMAAKVLPSILIMAVIFFWGFGKKGFIRFLVSSLAVTGLIMLPFILWNPDGFITGSVIYYMLVHEGGDTTSLYFYLPQVLKRPFLLSGYVVVFLFVLTAFLRRKEGVMAPLTITFLAYLLFTAFNWMTHINYVLSICALGAAGLGARIVSLSDVQSRGPEDVTKIVTPQ